MSFLGRGVIEFIHPAERERECVFPEQNGLDTGGSTDGSEARRDLTNAISADDLQGSVTR